MHSRRAVRFEQRSSGWPVSRRLAPAVLIEFYKAPEALKQNGAVEHTPDVTHCHGVTPLEQPLPYSGGKRSELLRGDRENIASHGIAFPSDGIHQFRE